MTDFPTRRDVERALRECGLSHRQARKFVSAGWPLVVGEQQAELDELKTLLADMASSLNRDLR
jgi:hypothetical protein